MGDLLLEKKSIKKVLTSINKLLQKKFNRTPSKQDKETYRYIRMCFTSFVRFLRNLHDVYL